MSVVTFLLVVFFLLFLLGGVGINSLLFAVAFILLVLALLSTGGRL